uniref:Cell division cycle associated 7 like n=1 Tax=Salarias fasciatus TaxID=181472 RepID=A0A672HIL9_SALFA
MHLIYAPCFKSKFITAELARLFSQSDSEEDFEGFSENEEENMRCSNKFPMKTPKQEAPKKNAKKPVKENPRSKRACRGPTKKKQQQQQEDEEEDKEEEEDDGEEVLYQSLKKRDKNIQENKAMKFTVSSPTCTLLLFLVRCADSVFTPQKKRRASEKVTPRKRKLDAGAVSERRNPSRKARPPENFAVEEKSETTRKPSGPRIVDLKRLVAVRDAAKSYGRRSRQVVKSVDEITEEDLENIAYRSKDKIWDKENGSSCHQCRQKTLDTKTVCRSGFCFGSKGQFCGPCLKNRYGEDVRTVLLDPSWSCPLCRGVCNCSLCRKREGRCATGILVGLARFNGHDNVHEYLESIQKELR